MKEASMLRIYLVLIPIVLSGCSRQTDVLIIQNKGSDTLVNLAQAWAEEYKKVNPRIPSGLSELEAFLAFLGWSQAGMYRWHYLLKLPESL